MSKKGSSMLNDLSNITKLSDSSGDESAGLEDINKLLYLETLKRFKDEEINIKRQVEETLRKYEDNKAEYRYFYELYVRLFKSSCKRAALEKENALSTEQLQQAKSDLSTVTTTVKNDKSIAYLDPDILKKCHELLCSMKNADKTKEIQSEMIEQKSSVNSIYNLTKTIQSKLEMATTQGLDYFVEMIQCLQLEDIAFVDHQDSSVEE